MWIVGIFPKLLEDSSPRLLKKIFIFGDFKDTLCDVSLECRHQARHIFGCSLRPCFLFYESHKSFCVMSREIQSETNLPLISRQLTHHKTPACSIRSSFYCTTHPPPAQKPPFLNSQPQLKNKKLFHCKNRSAKEQILLSFKSPVCNNSNENVCTFPNCKCMHVCWCSDSHPHTLCVCVPGGFILQN